MIMIKADLGKQVSRSSMTDIVSLLAFFGRFDNRVCIDLSIHLY